MKVKALQKLRQKLKNNEPIYGLQVRNNIENIDLESLL